MYDGSIEPGHFDYLPHDSIEPFVRRKRKNSKSIGDGPSGSKKDKTFTSARRALETIREDEVKGSQKAIDPPAQSPFAK